MTSRFPVWVVELMVVLLNKTKNIRKITAASWGGWKVMSVAWDMQKVRFLLQGYVVE